MENQNLMYVGIAVGIVAVIVIAYFMTRKKKKERFIPRVYCNSRALCENYENPGTMNVGLKLYDNHKNMPGYYDIYNKTGKYYFDIEESRLNKRGTVKSLRMLYNTISVPSEYKFFGFKNRNFNGEYIYVNCPSTTSKNKIPFFGSFPDLDVQPPNWSDEIRSFIIIHADRTGLKIGNKEYKLGIYSTDKSKISRYCNTSGTTRGGYLTWSSTPSNTEYLEKPFSLVKLSSGTVVELYSDNEFKILIKSISATTIDKDITADFVNVNSIILYGTGFVHGNKYTNSAPFLIPWDQETDEGVKSMKLSQTFN